MKNKEHASMSVVRTIVGPKVRRGNDCSLYNRWKHIRERCTNPKRKDYKWYGAKGVTIDPEWHSFKNFRRWFEVALRVYVINTNTNAVYRQLVIDRVDPRFGYGPGNCRLISVSENSRRAIKNRDLKGRFAIKE